jgi:FliI/YscN family ATPase
VSVPTRPDRRGQRSAPSPGSNLASGLPPGAAAPAAPATRFEAPAPERWRALIQAAAQPRFHGEVSHVSGLLIEASGLPAAIGELVEIVQRERPPIRAEVIGFRRDATLLMPHGGADGVAPTQRALALGRPFAVEVSNELLGRTLDGFGQPLDQGPPLAHAQRRSVQAEPPPALSRPPIDAPLCTGVRAIDGLTTLGRGQRLGIFAGSGVGKSSLLGQIARGSDADVIVLGLIGERGREVRGFLDEVLGVEGQRRAVTVVATSDRPPIERYTAPFVALTVAEHFRDQGLDVLLVMDSITRFAAASREIGLAAGEPPGQRGYPPRFFATIPKIVERMGRSARGSITGLLTVLLDGDDPNEPVADTLRGLLDGHIYLSRDLAHKGHFPAIDVLQSLSRLMHKLVPAEQVQLAQALREDLAQWKEGRDLVEIGAYKPGTRPALDRAMGRLPLIDLFLKQGLEERSDLAETQRALGLVAGELAPPARPAPSPARAPAPKPNDSRANPPPAPRPAPTQPRGPEAQKERPAKGAGR